MPTCIHQTAGHMRNQMRSMDTVAHNLANAGTPGFKRMITHFIDSGKDGSAIANRASFPELDARRIDFSQGPVQRTGRDLDVAVNGDAFLAVETENGLRLTRKGRMYMDREGNLHDGSGNPFASDGGAMQVPSGWDDLTIDGYGNVSVDGEELGRLTLLHIPDKENLRPAGNALYEYVGDRMEPAFEAEIVQQSIEQSNVKPMSEIVNLMMRALRSYEAGTQILTRVDELQGRVINTAS